MCVFLYNGSKTQNILKIIVYLVDRNGTSVATEVVGDVHLYFDNFRKIILKDDFYVPRFVPRFVPL